MNKIPKRDLSIEIMRILAAFFVIFNHGDGFTLYQQFETGSLRFYSYLFMAIFCKFAVPLFFMISGALLLGKEESIKDVLKKRVLKSIIVLFVISVIYYTYSLYTGRFTFCGFSNIIDFIGKFISGGIWGHLWFMYSYIVFLLVLPFFRMIIKSMDQKGFNYFFILTVIFNFIVPVLQYLMFKGEHELYISFNLFTMKNISPVFIGYWIYTKLNSSKVENKHILILWLINVATIILTCFLTHLTIINSGVNSGYDVELFFYNFASLNAATIFVTVKKYCKFDSSEKLSKIISSAGGATFGIFLLHYLTFQILPWFYYSAAVLSILGLPMVGWIVAAGIYFFVNLFIVILLKKFPLVKKYI